MCKFAKDVRTDLIKIALFDENEVLRKKYKKRLDKRIKMAYNYLCCETQVSAINFGSIAQLGEHLPYKQRVTGSSPVVPTKANDFHSLIMAW